MTPTSRSVTDRSRPKPPVQRQRRRRRTMTRSNGNRFGRVSRRQVLGGIAVGTASLAVGGTGRGRVGGAQEATPAAMATPGAAGISSEPFGEADGQAVDLY